MKVKRIKIKRKGRTKRVYKLKRCSNKECCKQCIDMSCFKVSRMNFVLQRNSNSHATQLDKNIYKDY